MNNDSGKLIVFVLISGVILFGYNYFFMPKTAPKTAAIQQAAGTKTSGGASSFTQAAEPAISGKNEPMVPASITAAAEKTYILENSLFTATFSSLGGTLKSFMLKKYSDSKDNKGSLELIPSKTAYTYLSLSSL